MGKFVDPLAGLDPGVRDIVEMLRAWGFDTTDSGDGRSKVAEIFDGEALDYAHVAAVTEPALLVEESERLLRVLAPWPGATVQGTYNPADGSAILFASWGGPL